MALTALVGSQSGTDFRGLGFGYEFGAYWKFDSQTLLGVRSGQGVRGDEKAWPILAAALVRLPLGSVVQPAATGGIGYAVADSGGFVWRAGGLLDIRNGRRSSILAQAEYERYREKGGLALRGGLLLEF